MLTKKLTLVAFLFLATNSLLNAQTTRAPAVEPAVIVSYDEYFEAAKEPIAVNLAGGEEIDLSKTSTGLNQKSQKSPLPWASILTLFTVFIALPMSVFWGLRQSLRNNGEDLDYSHITTPDSSIGPVINLSDYRQKNASSDQNSQSNDLGNVVPLRASKHQQKDQNEQKTKKVG